MPSNFRLALRSLFEPEVSGTKSPRSHSIAKSRFTSDGAEGQHNVDDLGIAL
jgi:hypothetical protein